MDGNMKWTLEPWRVDPENWMSIIDAATPWPRGLICQVNGKDRPEAEANARRIVACVNACAGIETEILEKLNKHTEGWLRAFEAVSDAFDDKYRAEARAAEAERLLREFDAVCESAPPVELITKIGDVAAKVRAFLDRSKP